MQSLTTTITVPEGLHARPAQVFCAAAGNFQSEVRVRNKTTGSGFVNAKSILLILTLGVVQGHEIEINCAGDDEIQALQTLSELIASNFQV
jgi:phosphocarrier protein HPr